MTLLIADGTNVLHRGHYAVPALSHRGQPTNALLGYFRVIQKQLRETKATNFVSTFDRKGTNFRHALWEHYKGTRPKHPEVSAAIHSQTPIAKDMLLAYGLSVVGKKGVEADDIVGCFAVNYDGIVYIDSTDKDMAQLLIHKNIRLINGHKKIIIDHKNCKEVYGFSPQQFVDFLMLDGDKIDNIPGIPGVGIATAQKLLAEYKRAERIPIERFPKGAQKTVNIEKQLKLNRKLVTIRTDVYDTTELDTSISPVDVKAFNKLCKKYGLTSLMV